MDNVLTLLSASFAPPYFGNWHQWSSASRDVYVVFNRHIMFQPGRPLRKSHDSNMGYLLFHQRRATFRIPPQMLITQPPVQGFELHEGVHQSRVRLRMTGMH